MTVDKRAPGIGTAFRNFDYERELDRLKRSGGTGSGGGSGSSVAMDPWHVVGAAGEPAFQNSWTNYGSGWATAGFRKDPLGKVRLRGLVKSGTLATVFKLPAGYWPPGHIAVASNTSGGLNIPGYTEVDSTGNVSCGGNNAACMLDLEF